MSDIDVAKLVKELEDAKSWALVQKVSLANSREAFEGLKGVLSRAKLENEALSNINESLVKELEEVKSFSASQATAIYNMLGIIENRTEEVSTTNLENETLNHLNEGLETENTSLKSMIENLRERDKTLAHQLRNSMSMVAILEKQNGDLESRVREFTLTYDERAGA